MTDKLDLDVFAVLEAEHSATTKTDRQLLTTLFALGREVASVLDLDELLTKLPELIARITDFHAFAIYLLDDSRGDLRIACSKGYPPTSATMRLKLTDGLVGAAVTGGRPLVAKYGKYILISHHDLDLADRWFQRWGNWAVFASRLLPVVRTFISLPAGVSRMPVWQFSIYSFLGAFPWSLGLAWAGYVLGENWEDLRSWMRPADIPILIVVVVLAALYVYRHVKRAWGEEPQPSRVEES